VKHIGTQESGGELCEIFTFWSFFTISRHPTGASPMDPTGGLPSLDPGGYSLK